MNQSVSLFVRRLIQFSERSGFDAHLTGAYGMCSVTGVFRRTKDIDFNLYGVAPRNIDGFVHALCQEFDLQYLSQYASLKRRGAFIFTERSAGQKIDLSFLPFRPFVSPICDSALKYESPMLQLALKLVAVNGKTARAKVTDFFDIYHLARSEHFHIHELAQIIKNPQFLSVSRKIGLSQKDIWHAVLGLPIRRVSAVMRGGQNIDLYHPLPQDVLHGFETARHLSRVLFKKPSLITREKFLSDWLVY